MPLVKNSSAASLVDVAKLGSPLDALPPPPPPDDAVVVPSRGPPAADVVPSKKPISDGATAASSSLPTTVSTLNAASKTIDGKSVPSPSSNATNRGGGNDGAGGGPLVVAASAVRVERLESELSRLSTLTKELRTEVARRGGIIDELRETATTIERENASLRDRLGRCRCGVGSAAAEWDGRTPSSADGSRTVDATFRSGLFRAGGGGGESVASDSLDPFGAADSLGAGTSAAPRRAPAGAAPPSDRSLGSDSFGSRDPFGATDSVRGGVGVGVGGGKGGGFGGDRSRSVATTTSMTTDDSCSTLGSGGRDAFGAADGLGGQSGGNRRMRSVRLGRGAPPLGSYEEEGGNDGNGNGNVGGGGRVQFKGGDDCWDDFDESKGNVGPPAPRSSSASSAGPFGVFQPGGGGGGGGASVAIASLFSSGSSALTLDTGIRDGGSTIAGDTLYSDRTQDPPSSYGDFGVVPRRPREGGSGSSGRGKVLKKLGMKGGGGSGGSKSETKKHTTVRLSDGTWKEQPETKKKSDLLPVGSNLFGFINSDLGAEIDDNMGYHRERGDVEEDEGGGGRSHHHGKGETQKNGNGWKKNLGSAIGALEGECR